jgi:hypothetical protein
MISKLKDCFLLLGTVDEVSFCIDSSEMGEVVDVIATMIV